MTPSVVRGLVLMVAATSIGPATAAAQTDDGPPPNDEEPAPEPPVTHDDVIIAQPDPSPSPPSRLVPDGGVPPIRPQVPPGQPGFGLPQPEPTPLRPQRPPPPPLPPPQYSVALHVRVAFPEESSFDQALSAFGYSGVRLQPVGYVGVAIPVIDWLWIGGRLGMRGRHWTHLTQDAAVVGAGDLLATAQLRFALGRVVELGALVGGGAGAVVVRMNGIDSDQIVGRFQVEATIAFRAGRHFAIGPRLGWDYFQWEGLNRYDHGLDIGGFFVGLTLEGRE